MELTRDKSFFKNFFALYVIIVLQNVIVLSVNLADNIMVGAYNETSLSGVASVNQLQFIFQQIIMGTGETLVVMGSQYWGQKRTKPIKALGAGARLLTHVERAGGERHLRLFRGNRFHLRLLFLIEQIVVLDVAFLAVVADLRPIDAL